MVLEAFLRRLFSYASGPDNQHGVTRFSHETGEFFRGAPKMRRAAAQALLLTAVKDASQGSNLTVDARLELNRLAGSLRPSRRFELAALG